MNLAARGARQLDYQPEKIEDAAELAQVKLQARKVHLKSIAAAVVLSLIALALPVLA